MKIWFLLPGLLFFQLAGAQKVNQCGIIIPQKSTQSKFQSVYEAKGYINTMLDSINWKENFTLREQYGINNAYATIINSQRYIIYDNDFLESLDEAASTKWASISVLAHEMGHHYRNHLVDSRGSTPPKELEADYFSGYVMAMLGASMDEAVQGMAIIASPNASASHPAKNDRLAAIGRGWNYAKGVASTGPVPPPQQNPPPPASDASWIYLYLYGNSDMTVFLSDDGKTYTGAPLKTTQPFVFKFEIYNYGWLRFGNDNRTRRYQLTHGKDYAIIWSRRTNSWTLVQVP